MEKDNYWSRRNALTRRKVLLGAGAGGAGLAALALTGCGGDDAKPTATVTTGGTTTTGSATTAATATEQVKKGGTLRGMAPNYPSALDPQTTSDSTVRGSVAGFVYSKLLANEGVPLGDRFPSQNVVADLAQSWETTGDGLTVTMKLNPKAKWHAPISRAVTADDVVFTYNRFFGKVAGVPAAANLDQLSMVDGVTAPDKSTLVWKLKAPSATFLLKAADDYVLPIMPTETGTAFDPTKTMVGSGAWAVDQLNTGVSFRWKRNPEWHFGPERPYLDAAEWTVIKEPATALTQFKGNNLDSYGPVAPKDLPGVKDAVKAVQIIGVPNPFIGFLALSGKDPNAPWNKDVRVRYAMSMALDRNALFDALYSPNELKAAGIPAPKTVWHNVLPAGLGPNWLDPQGDKINPKLKPYFKYDVDGAKKLLSEAGFPNGFSAEYHYTNIYGANWVLHAELVQQMLGKAGIKLETKVDDYASVYLTKTFRGGDFDGLAMIYQGFASPLDYLTAMYIPESPRNQSRVNDPVLTDRINKLVQNLNAEARTKEVLDLQNYLAEKMYVVPAMYDSGPGYTVYQPNIKGINDFNTSRSGQGFWRSYAWKA